MFVRVIAFLCLASAGLSATTLYKVVDKDGSVTFTDVPRPGATPVVIGKANVADTSSNVLRNNSQPKTVQIQYPDYVLSMNSPANGATIRNNFGRINVSATLSPQGAGQFQLFLDDSLVETSGTPVFQLENVDRGEHHLQIKFLHNSGKILASTQKRVVYLHRTSVLINAN